MITELPQKACCFTGHRPEKLPWKQDETDPRCATLKTVLADVLEAVYADGCRRFICGMAAGADMYFGEGVVALRQEHPDVTLEGAIPFRGQERRWSKALRDRYFELSVLCDRITVLRDEYTPGCMMERNRYMVDNADLLIAVYDGRPGGTLNTIRYAQKRGRTILRLPLE